jgi:hypothetical protein
MRTRETPEEREQRLRRQKNLNRKIARAKAKMRGPCEPDPKLADEKGPTHDEIWGTPGNPGLAAKVRMTSRIRHLTHDGPAREKGPDVRMPRTYRDPRRQA